MARTSAWQRPIPDAPDESALRLDSGGAHAVIGDQVVSTPDAMNAAALMVALGGDPFPWYPTVLAARTTLDLAVAANVSHSEALRAVRILTRLPHIRIQAAQADQYQSGTAAWSRVALSMDPERGVRRALAATALTGTIGDLILDRLLADRDPLVLHALTQRRDALYNPALLSPLIEHPKPEVRRAMAERLPANSAWIGMLLADPDPTVVIAAERVVRADRASRETAQYFDAEWN